MSIAIPLIGILLSLVLLITLAYRGHSVIVVAPVCALVAAAFSGVPLLATYTQVFMPALGSFIVNFFPLFLVGAIFGRLMTISGMAESLATWISRALGPKHAILATVLATALLTYGGVSAWVIAFTIYPIGVALFQQAGLPKRLMPAAIALGIFTFATAALPGSPQIHNAIPTRFFDTTTYAAPIIGVIGAVITFSLGMLWLNYRQRTLSAAGETYYSHLPEHERESAAREDADAGIGLGTAGAAPKNASGRDIHVQGLIGLIPVLVVVAVNLLFVYVLSEAWDFGYLSEERFGETTLSAVLGLWSVTTALVAAIISIFVLRPGSLRKLVTGLSEGARNAVLPAFTTASEVGYGAVVASLAIFVVIRDGLFGVTDNALVLGSLATAVIAGITGSSSGGLTITLQSFSEDLTRLAAEQGIALEFMHRAMAMASVSFDSLPHNGAIITLLLVTGMTHRQAYKDIGVVTVIVPAIGVIAVMLLGSLVPALV